MRIAAKRYKVELEEDIAVKEESLESDIKQTDQAALPHGNRHYRGHRTATPSHPGNHFSMGRSHVAGIIWFWQASFKTCEDMILAQHCW